MGGGSCCAGGGCCCCVGAGGGCGVGVGCVGVASGDGRSGAVVAWVSFGGVMLATRLGGVGEAAALRETSAVFAALWGWLLLGERPGAGKVGLMALIALGAVLTQMRL